MQVYLRVRPIKQGLTGHRPTHKASKVTRGRAVGIHRPNGQNHRPLGGLGPEKTPFVYRCEIHRCALSQAVTLPKELSRHLIL